MARPGLSGHRKFRRLARALGSPLLARGALELLWDSCYENGDDYVGTAEDIEHAVGWSGEAGMLTRALADAGAPLGVGFIERLEGSSEPVFQVHDLWHHAPDYVAKRRQRELARQGKVDPVTSRPPNGAERRRDEECQDGSPPPPSPSPSPSPTRSPSPSPGDGTSRIAFPVFPTAGIPDSWRLSDAQIAEWQGLYEGIDVRAECRKAYAWVLSKGGHKKTARGMPKFLVGWLSRATDTRRGGSDRRPGDRGGSERHVPEFDARLYDWQCPHTPRCGNRSTCAIVTARTERSS